MKVVAKDLAAFLAKVTMNCTINDCVLAFEPDGLHIIAKDTTGTGAANGFMNRSEFSDYQEIRMPINNTTLFTNVLKGIDGIVDIAIVNNFIKLTSDSDEGELIMPKEEFIDCKLDRWPSLKPTTEFEVDASILDKSKKQAQNLTSNNIVVSVVGNVFQVKSGEENFDRLSVKCTVNSSVDAISRYGEIFFNIVPALKGKVQVKLGTDYPMTITSVEGATSVTWMLAPIIDSKEE